MKGERGKWIVFPKGWHIAGHESEREQPRPRRTLEQAIGDLRTELAELESALAARRRRLEGPQN